MPIQNWFIFWKIIGSKERDAGERNAEERDAGEIKGNKACVFVCLKKKLKIPQG